VTRSALGPAMVLAVAGIILLLSGCESVPDPVIPPQEKAASQSDAEAQYREYRLSKVGHTFWGAHYLQGNKPYRYSHQRLSHLYALSSPEAQGAYREGTNLMIGRSVLGAVGGGFFGYPLGWYFTYDEFGPTEYVFLGVGVMSAAVSVLLAVLADDAFEEATAAYNLDLRHTLGAE
jgi:uncharacterized protein YceK